MAETPAAELRDAAKLLRERASLVPPPPWIAHTLDVTTNDPLNVISGSGLPARAQYIATMHPGVALAVADWLDESAEVAERDLVWENPEGPCCAEPSVCGGHDPVWYHADCDGVLVSDCHCFDKALAVARTYLGSDPR